MKKIKNSVRKQTESGAKILHQAQYLLVGIDLYSVAQKQPVVFAEILDVNISFKCGTILKFLCKQSYSPVPLPDYVSGCVRRGGGDIRFISGSYPALADKQQEGGYGHGGENKRTGFDEDSFHNCTSFRRIYGDILNCPQFLPAYTRRAGQMRKFYVSDRQKQQIIVQCNNG